MTDQSKPSPVGLARIADGLLTPIYAKLEDGAPWPEDDVFYMLSSDGLHLCRNHRFFRSSVPAVNAPCELALHETFAHLKAFPRIPTREMELAVGFCLEIYERHGSEAGLLLVWNEEDERMRLVCPDQVGTVSRSWSGTHPIGLRYTLPTLGAHDVLVGDLHSHGDEPAYASATDRADEERRTGLHVVVGRLGSIAQGERPDFYMDMVTDGTRFRINRTELVMEGYETPRMDVPEQWLDQVKIEDLSYSTSSGGTRRGSRGASGGGSGRINRVDGRIDGRIDEDTQGGRYGANGTGG